MDRPLVIPRVILPLLLLAAVGPARAAIDPEFERAIRYGSVADVTAAVAGGADLSQRDYGGNTPLHWAAESQSAGKVRALLEARADVNAHNNEGQTPLLRVVADDERWAPAIDALLEAKGLDLEAADKQGRTALRLASESQFVGRARRLLEMGAKDSLHAAAARGDVPSLVRQLDAGAGVNATDAGSVTPLMVSARCGRVEAIRVLARRRGALDAGDHEGKTALMIAALAGQVDAVDALLALGADLNRTDRSGATLVDYAVFRIRHANGHEHEKADALALRVLAEPRARPHVRAAALLRLADVARDGSPGPVKPVKDPKKAEELYRQAFAEAPASRPGTMAAWSLGQLLKQQGRHAELAEALVPLLVEDVTEANLFGGRRVVWRPNPDHRHDACVEIAEAYTKLERYPEALKYARLARDKFTYSSFCGTGLEEILQSVDDRVKKLERLVAAGGPSRVSR